MSDINFASLPPLLPGETGPHVCETVQLYLAVWNDLTSEQRRAASAHIRTCANCTAEQSAMSRATQLVATLDSSTPSARVDQAVLAVIAARSNGYGENTPYPLPLRRKYIPPKSKRRRSPLRLVGALVAAAAVILLATFSAMSVLKVASPPQQAFALPSTLSWSNYVIYHTQTKMASNGKSYHIVSYHDFGAGRINVETVQEGILDIVLVGDGHDTLGMDEMHHVAQWGADQWSVNKAEESMFDLNDLRKDMAAHHAIYLGEDQFKGQTVYRIHYDNGLVLLLNKHYLPVNVLRGAVGPGTGEPVYDKLQLLSPSNVPSSMWEMQVPTGYKMGTLPAKP